MRRLLLIEDEDVIRRALTRLLERNRYETVAVGDVDAAEVAGPDGFDIVLADLRLPGRDGTAVIPLADPVPVVVMTSHASVRSAVEAMRAGASDYIAKPFDHDELLLVLERASSRNRLTARNRALERDIGRAEPAAERVRLTSLSGVVDALLAEPDADAPLRLVGEPGSGREDVARVLHARGPHADGPLVVLDGDDAAADEAITGRPGTPGTALDALRGGTLVLRHPERLAPQVQDALAARLEAHDGDGTRIGNAPFRLVAITDRLADERASGLSETAHEGLASDAALSGSLDESRAESPGASPGASVGGPLAASLAARRRTVAPLEERRGDIAPLARRAAAAFGRRHAGRPATLSEAALALLGARDWPGNVAELERTIELAVLRALPASRVRVASTASDAGSGTALALPDTAFGPIADDVGTTSGAGADTVPATLDLDAYFRFVVLRLQGELSETDIAARLGISRKALWERRHRMGLPKPSSAPGKP